jgi:hypothetical protein
MSESAKEDLSQPDVAKVLDYASPILLPKQSETSRIISYVIFGGLLLFVAAMLLPAPGPRSRPAYRTQCIADLHEIGNELFMYSNSNGGKLPDSWESAILSANTMSPQTWAKLLVCPQSIDTPAPGTTAQQVAANLHALGRPMQFLNSKNPPPLHVSYVYLGKGFTLPMAVRKILVFEPPEHHVIGKQSSINVVWTDGAVETYTLGATQMQKLMSEFQAEQNPPATIKALNGLP